MEAPVGGISMFVLEVHWN